MGNSLDAKNVCNNKNVLGLYAMNEIDIANRNNTYVFKVSARNRVLNF